MTSEHTAIREELLKHSWISSPRVRVRSNLVLCQTSKLGLPWQFHQVNQRVQYIITLKSQFDGALAPLVITVTIKLVFRTLHRGFCLLRTEQGFYGLTARLSGLHDGFNGHELTRIGSEPC